MRAWILAAATALLMGCQASGPPPRIYVLTPPVDPVPGVRPETGRPVLELAKVSLPDYLDSSDILLRDGRNELKPSTTGKWGERLSVGITHALGATLARRLPRVLVVQAALSGQNARRLLVDVEAFDIRADGRCVLTARWTVPKEDGPASTAISARATVITQASGTAGAAGLADGAVVSAMEAALSQLGDHIAASLAKAF